MSDIKDYYIVRDEILNILMKCLNNDKITNYSGVMSDRIKVLYSRLSSDTIQYRKTIDVARSLLDRIKVDIENIEEGEDSHVYLRDLRYVIDELYRMSRVDNSNRIIDYNSENYYTEQIKELKEKEKSLNNELTALKQQNTDYAEKEKELEIIKGQIIQSEAEKEELKKKLDARDNMTERISKAFVELKKHISSLEDEKNRLKRMFYIYAIFGVVALGILIYFEVLYLSKWEGAEKWIDCLRYYIPVPIAAGLLWTFIYQTNRAQRQLIQVANVLYHVDYVEGLLLAINLVSADVNSASEKISNVLDDLIKNYMSIPDSLSEQSLDTEISKDNINLHTFINLAKEVKDVIK